VEEEASHIAAVLFLMTPLNQEAANEGSQRTPNELVVKTTIF
jgi:hypothetical protein